MKGIEGDAVAQANVYYPGEENEEDEEADQS